MGGRLVASDYQVASRVELKKPTAKDQERDRKLTENLAALARLGVEVDRQVDATDPSQYPDGEFDLIIFNHPFAGADSSAGRGAEGANVKLVSDFVAAAKQRIGEHGKIAIISSKFRLSRWHLDELANRLGLEQTIMKFHPELFPGYVHEQTEKAQPAKSAATTEQFAVILAVKTAIEGK
jgi:tRNA1(Val) A37 N6-methylase TrmN6